MATVSGKVALDGQPVTGGRVIFLHVEGPSATADIQPDGTYQATGVAVGKNSISIDHRDKPEAAAGGRESLLIPGKSLVPELYASGSTSGLTLDVKSGANDYNIEMTSQGRAPGGGPERAPR
ncbi:MAG: hypothetical protein GXY83_24655 [Rhodopirellula sp.]|nr:hypothetical protein [Rhodopirellula sp.]